MIKTEGDCRDAATEMGLVFKASWDGNGDHPGCLHAVPHGNGSLVYFNTSPNPATTADPRYISICKKSTSPGKLWRSDGRCGKGFNNDMGTPGQCNPEASANREGPCCSSVNWCGNSDAHCKCDGCVDYSAIKPLDAKMSSLYKDRIATNCIDGSTTNNKMCHTYGKESYPWVTLVIPHSTVTRVRITNRKDGYGDRMKNMKIWIGKEFPSTTKVEY